MKLSPPEFKILDMKEILITIYYIFSYLFLYFNIFICFPVLLFLIIFSSPLNFNLFILLLLVVIKYFILLKLSILLKKHSSDLMENKKLTPENKKMIFICVLCIFLLELIHSVYLLFI